MELSKARELGEDVVGRSVPDGLDGARERAGEVLDRVVYPFDLAFGNQRYTQRRLVEHRQKTASDDQMIDGLQARYGVPERPTIEIPEKSLGELATDYLNLIGSRGMTGIDEMQIAFAEDIEGLNVGFDGSIVRLVRSGDGTEVVPIDQETADGIAFVIDRATSVLSNTG